MIALPMIANDNHPQIEKVIQATAWVFNELNQLDNSEAIEALEYIAKLNEKAIQQFKEKKGL